MNRIYHLILVVWIFGYALALAQDASVKVAPENEAGIVKRGVGNLAVVKPNLPEEIDKNSVDAFWHALETTVQNVMKDSKEYRVILRSDTAFGNLINEIGFQGTHLVNERGERLQPNVIEKVGTLLCCAVGKFGTKYTISMYLTDARAAIKSEYSSIDVFGSLDELIEALEYSVSKLFEREKIKDVMLLNPSFAEDAKRNGEEMTAIFQDALTDKVTMAYSHDISEFLEEMKKKNLDGIKASEWKRFQRIVAVRFLVVPKITQFAFTDKEEAVNPYDVNERTAWCEFAAEGIIYVIDTGNGKTLATIKLNTIHASNTELYSKANPAKKMTISEFKRLYPAMALNAMAEKVAGHLGDVLMELAQKH